MTQKPPIDVDRIDPSIPVLIAGPTAVGKSSLALEVAARTGGAIVNADALQVYDGWHILTARPGAQDQARAPHHLYGHVSYRDSYSVGAWLRDITPLLKADPAPVIVGGTGLYFAALTEGLAEIPATPPEIRAKADAHLARVGLTAMCAELDSQTSARIDRNNPMRVQRAWEVLAATGRGLAAWQDETPAPLLPLSKAQGFVMNAGKDWLNARINQRFDQMITGGALDEARQMEPDWDPARLSSKAIGAAQLIAHLRRQMTLAEATWAAKVASHQYAKRQRSWFRGRMKSWAEIAMG